MIPQSDVTTPLPTFQASFCLKVLGVGGAGGNALTHLARQLGDGPNLAVLNTDAAALSRSGVVQQLTLGAKSMRGLGAGGDPDRGRAAAEEELSAIRALCSGADVVFVVAGLGGGTGTGASPVIARAAKESGALVLGLVFLPFECEGQQRQRRALLGLSELKAAADGVICLPNQKVFNLIDESTTLLDAFAVMHDFVGQAVRGLGRLLARQGLINVDFADLRAVTQGKHAESSLATADGRGDQRVQQLLDRLMRHPMIDGGQALAHASEILVSLAGGPDLTMTEVDRIVRQISAQSPSAHIILGAAIEESLRETISVTLVASNSREQTLQVPLADPPSTGSRIPEPDAPTTDSPSPEHFPRGGCRLGPGPLPAGRGEAPRLEGRRDLRRGASRLRQAQLPLEMISKGRFEKTDPTIHQGEDLDVPTYIRRGVALN